MVRMTQRYEFGNAELGRLTQQLDELKGYVKGSAQGALPVHEVVGQFAHGEIQIGVCAISSGFAWSFIFGIFAWMKDLMRPVREL